MNRSDMSSCLIHWTKDSENESAFETLCKICDEMRLLGGNGLIKGGHTCICFTEAPPNCSQEFNGRYSRFGIKFNKRHIFSLGGRPVIYQPDSDYERLPPSLKWRHVRHELDGEVPIDFTWEREWRVPLAELCFDLDDVSFIVPSEEYAQALSAGHSDNQEYRALMSILVFEQYFSNQPPIPISIEILDLP